MEQFWQDMAAHVVSLRYLIKKILTDVRFDIFCHNSHFDVVI